MIRNSLSKSISTASFLLSALTFLFVSNTSAQGNITNPTAKLTEIIPPSPNAASLAKYGNTPVNYHTGLPSVSIPIYQWSNRNAGLEFSSGFNYHTGGVKVEEVASNVGLGWSLNAGGVITRTMRGIPDEMSNGFLNTGIVPDIGTTTYSGEFIYHDINYPASKVIKSDNSASYGLVTNIYNNTVDAQQDVFFYNFNGKSGKFFIGKDKSIVTQQKDNIQINLISGSNDQLQSFEIIDDRGNKYIFNEQEITTSYSTTITENAIEQQSVPVTYTSSWYLGSIKSPGEEYDIKLNYDGYNQNYLSGFSASISMNASDDYSTPGYDQYSVRSRSRSYATTNITGKKIKQITFPDSVKIIFDYGNTLRVDIDGDSPLAKVTVLYNGKTKGLKLSQSYFDNNNLSTANNLRKRLKLDQITEFGGNSDLPPYRFYYNELQLPDRNSNYQDYWGYTVGPERNIVTLIPRMTYYDLNDGYNNKFNDVLEGGDREADPLYVKAASLRQIDYPAGGQTIFDFECNDAYGDDFVSVKPVKSNSTFTQSSVNNNLSLGFIDNKENLLELSIGIIENGPRPVNDPPTYFDEDINNQSISFILKKTDNSWASTLYTGRYGDFLNTTRSFKVTPSGSATYVLYIEYDNRYGINFTGNTEVKYYIKAQERLIGGLRIKSISDKSSVADPLINTRNFAYKTLDNKSSGKVPQFPMYDFYRTTQPVYLSASLQYLGTTEILNRSAESTQPLGVIQGSPVGYSRVEMSYLPANGKVIYEYSPLVYFDYITYYPYKNGEYISWGAGLLKKEYTYDNFNNLKRSIDNDYQLVYNNLLSDQHRSLKVGLVYSDNNNTNDRKGYTTAVTYPVLGYANLTQTVERDYSGANFVEKQTNMSYDDNYNLLKESSSTTNNGTKITRYFYPFHFTGIPVFQEMTRANIINQHVKQETWKVYNGNSQQYLLSASATFFTSLVNHTRTFRPSAEFVLQNSFPLALDPSASFSPASLFNTGAIFENRINYEKYSDDKGVLNSYLTDALKRKAFLWRNNQLYLKASIDNASDNEVFYEDFETREVNGGNGHSGENYHSGAYVASWPAPNHKTYRISYWYLENNKWKYAEDNYSNGMVLNKGIAIDDVLIYPASGFVSAYSIDPLSGMIYHTDPKGTTTYYEYDEFMRLKTISDQNRNIIKSNIYNYHP